MYLLLFPGPLRNRATLFEWISAIHFEGEMIQMLEAGDLLHPKDWQGGGKSNGRICNPAYLKCYSSDAMAQIRKGSQSSNG